MAASNLKTLVPLTGPLLPVGQPHPRAADRTAGSGTLDEAAAAQDAKALVSLARTTAIHTHKAQGRAPGAQSRHGQPQAMQGRGRM